MRQFAASHALRLPHPAGLRGNSAVPLISRDGGDNDDFHGCMRTTPHLHGCQYLQQVMASFDEVLGRSRLMKLAPHCEVSTHVDFNYYWYTRVRVHVPITTNPGVIFHCGPIAPVMTPGELDAMVRELVDDFANHPDNDPVLVKTYCDLLMDLAHDWRELWLRFGYSHEGWPQYEALIAGVRRQLHANPRALVTESNQVGVNPIVVQRILNALLAPDQLPRFTAKQGQ
jgi:hypothetical protein